MEDWRKRWSDAKKMDHPFPEPDITALTMRLGRPTGKVDVVLDTDTFNEIDDQFALAYLIRSEEKFSLKAVYAAPFYNDKSSGPADGMEKSYREILNLLSLAGREDLIGSTYRGSEEFLSDEESPVDSPAARDLAVRAMEYTSEHPLYVIAIGAITNVASAILMNPAIIDRIVIVWLGGHAHFWPDAREFNLFQDVAAGRIIFNCGAALVQLPCMGVVSSFTVSGPELISYLKDKNPLCDHLLKYTVAVAEKESTVRTWSRVIWDVTTIAWFFGDEFEQDYLVHSPIIEYDGRYVFDNRRHLIRYVYHVDRDRILNDLVEKLTKRVSLQQNV